jgi:hypothetical protein
MTTDDYSALTTAQLYAAAEENSRDIEGRQWKQGALGIEVKRRAEHGNADFAQFVASARRSKSTLYAYANTVAFYQAAGFSNWSDFSARYPRIPFTVAAAAADKFKDDTAALSWLEDANERAFTVDQARASLSGIFNSDAPRKVAEFEAWLMPNGGDFSAPVLLGTSDDYRSAVELLCKQFNASDVPLRVIVYAPATEAA